MAGAKPAVVGIDLGASESYVAFVGKGIVDIVQNEVSKRNTSTLVGFTDRERLLGDAALALIRSNAKNTCRNFKHLLGRKVDSPDLDIEKFWSTSALCECDDGLAGYDVTYKGEPRKMSATVCTAMYLTKLREITEKWCVAKVQDVVISVPSSFSDVQRQAVLDAAKISGLSVLRIMNEHTATALAYGIYRSNDFDAEKPIVQFIRGKLQVLCEKSDKVGGRNMDECLMREFAAQFKKKFGCDPLSSKKACFKLEDAVTKTKKVLSANYEANLSVECLMEDEDFSSQMTRESFEKMCEPMMERVKAVLQGAIEASKLTLDEIDSVEIVGGATRVPWVKKMFSEAFGNKDLSTTMNQEESVARGCALQAAILSPLYKVRDFEVKDATSFGINVGWMGSSADAGEKEDDGDEKMGGADGEYKTAQVFPAGSALNTVKLMTFFRNGPFDIKAEFTDDSSLLPLTTKDLGTFKVELPPQTETKKVKVKAKLTMHGTFAIETAQMVEEEEYEEFVKEKRELPPSPEPEVPEEKEAMKEEPKAEEDGDAPMPDQEEAEKKEEGEVQEKAEEKKPEKKEPKFEWVDVVRKKKRTKRTDLNISKSNTPGLSDADVQKREDEETAIIAEMKEIVETDEKRNDLEGYILNTRDKISETGEWGAFVSGADREKFSKDLTTAEDWLYDNPESTKVQYIDKLDELKSLGDVIQWRFKESTMREEWTTALQGTITNYRAAAESPGDKYGHIAPEKLAKIVKECNELETWLKEKKEKQDAMPKYEKPVLICAEMDKKNQELAKTADEILKEPKPAPEEKVEEEPEAAETEAEEPAKGDNGDEEPAKGEEANPDEEEKMDVD